MNQAYLDSVTRLLEKPCCASCVTVAARKLLAELTHLRAKAAAGAKLREALPIRTRHPCRSCSVDYLLDEMNDAAGEYDAEVSEGDTK